MAKWYEENISNDLVSCRKCGEEFLPVAAGYLMACPDCGYSSTEDDIKEIKNELARIWIEIEKLKKKL